MGEALSKPIVVEEPKPPIEREPFKPCPETARLVCRMFVRVIRGRDPVAFCEAVKGFGEADCESKVYRKASTVTYPIHPELSQEWYDYLETLLANKARVKYTLHRNGIEAIDRDDTEPDYRMRHKRERLLKEAYKTIARRYRIRKIEDKSRVEE